MTLCITSLFVLDRFVDFLACLSLRDGCGYSDAECVADAAWCHESVVG